jgi:hypothetical protein
MLWPGAVHHVVMIPWIVRQPLAFCQRRADNIVGSPSDKPINLSDIHMLAPNRIEQLEERSMAKNSRREADDEGLDYEVIDEEPGRKRRSDDDDERPRSNKRNDHDEDNSPRRKKREDVDDDERPRARNRSEDDEDDRPRSRKRNDADEDDRRRDNDEGDEEEDRPRRKKKKKKKKDLPRVDSSLLLEERPRKSQMEIGDWMIAGMFFGSGFIMCLVAAIGIAGMKHAFLALFVMFVYFLLLLPISIGALMGVGILMNIDYGEWKVTIMKLAAIAAFNNGLIWVGEWIGLPFFLTLSFCGLVLFGMLMALFDLDPQEALITVAGLNLVQFVARFILIGLAFLQARHEDRKGDRDDSDDRPKFNKKIDQDFGKGKGQMPDDDDPDNELPFPP